MRSKGTCLGRPMAGSLHYSVHESAPTRCLNHPVVPGTAWNTSLRIFPALARIVPQNPARPSQYLRVNVSFGNLFDSCKTTGEGGVQAVENATTAWLSVVPSSNSEHQAFHFVPQCPSPKPLSHLPMPLVPVAVTGFLLSLNRSPGMLLGLRAVFSQIAAESVQISDSLLPDPGIR